MIKQVLTGLLLSVTVSTPVLAEVTLKESEITLSQADLNYTQIVCRKIRAWREYNHSQVVFDRTVQEFILTYHREGEWLGLTGDNLSFYTLVKTNKSMRELPRFGC